MTKKKNKARLRKVDLDVVLKLKDDYCNLQHDVLQLMMFIFDFEQLGTVRRNVLSSDPNITSCYNEIYNAIKEGRYKPSLTHPGWKAAFGKYENVSVNGEEEFEDVK
jgi:hypothetical protein